MRGGRISEETVQYCKDFLDFTRCERPNGTAYGTGGKCRKGVEAERDIEENRRLVKAALAASSEEFNSKFYPLIERKINNAAKDFEERVKNDTFSDDDEVKLTAAEMFLAVKRRYDKAAGENEKLAEKIAKTGEFFVGIKWRCDSPVTLISSGTLKAAWDGNDVGAKAKDVFPEDAKDQKFGQSKAAVGEHPHPSAILLKQLLGLKTNSPSKIVSFAMEKNLVSWTAATEDGKMTAMGYKHKSPNEDEVLSRYKAAGIKAFPIRKDLGLTQKGRDFELLPKKLLKSALEAKSKGDSFEDWVASVVAF
jgi:hypothetical protein